MRRLVFALLCGLVLVPLPVHAQGSVTLTVCNTGTVDIDVFVSSPPGSAFSSHIRPAACAAVAESAGGTQPAYVGLAFTDSRGQWGAARRFDGVPYMGSSSVLSRATRNEMVQRGNASVSLPLQLLFRPRVPQCVRTGTTVPDQGRIYVGATYCEELVYTLTVEAYPDTREIRLSGLPVGGAMSANPPYRFSEKTAVNWAEEEAARKAREAPQPVNWSDLLSTLTRMAARERLSSGAPLRLPGDVIIRGTVSAVEIRQQPPDSSFYSWRPPAPQPFDANATIPVVEINFCESPLAAGRPYPEFNVCTERLDILTEQFGADFRTSMIGKVIEVRGIANLPGTVCWGPLGEIQLFLARQVREVPSVQFAAGSRVWVPPPAAPPPPPRPAPTAAEIAAENAGYARTAGTLAYSQVELRAKGRLSAACGAQHEKAIAANPRNRIAIDTEYFACRGAVKTNARAEALRGAECAQQIVGADPESMKRDLDGTWQKIYDCAAASAPAPVAAVVPPPVTPAPAAIPMSGSRLTVTPTARAGALPIASITAQWVGRSVVATGTVARVQTIRGVEHVYFEGAGEKYVLCVREGMPGMQHPSELVGKTLEMSVRIDWTRGCLDQGVPGPARDRWRHGPPAILAPQSGGRFACASSCVRARYSARFAARRSGETRHSAEVSAGVKTTGEDVHARTLQGLSRRRQGRSRRLSEGTPRVRASAAYG
jgi:hypothetical protein